MLNQAPHDYPTSGRLLPDGPRTTRYDGPVNDRQKPDGSAPPADNSAPPEQRTRRGDGARQTVSEPVVFHRGDETVDGWALNMSRGGLRAIVESPLEVGAEFQIAVGESDTRRPGRIVWVQHERDGAIVGVSFLDVPRPSEPPKHSDWPDPPEPD